jgi:hypothetical protein
VTHVRYEDLVHDLPGVAKKIVAATGLEWDDNVLEFHKKKQAVNTLSTTQVRKGVYKDSLQSWKRYETHLSPLVKLIGSRTVYDLKTTLAGYEPPPPDAKNDEANNQDATTETKHSLDDQNLVDPDETNSEESQESNINEEL